MSRSNASAPYLLLSVLCFGSILWIAYDFCEIHQKTKTTVSVEAISEYGVSDSVDLALRTQITAPKTDFPPNIISPFKALSARSVGSSRNATGSVAGKHRRLSLRLKGLMKNPPLAILEDTRGETHIKARGDSIQNSKIIAINGNSVIFKDSSGTYELTVEESQ